MRHGGPFPGEGTKPDTPALGPPLWPPGARGLLLFHFTRYHGVLWFAPLSHFLGKEVEPEQLKAVLTHVAAGGTFFEAGESLPEYLTDAESQVLAMTAKGMKRRAIAETLSLSERTVSNHLQHVFEKLEVNSALEAVAKARALGYLPPT